MRRYSRSVVLFAAFGFALPLTAQTVTRDVPYTTDAAGVQRGDLYQPVGLGPFPVIVYLHGGSWRSGNKREFRRLGMDLVRRDYASFSVDYDLRAHSFPLSWEEARAAIRFLRGHLMAYRIDPSRIAVAGTSAGGELAALVALAPDGPAGAKGNAGNNNSIYVSSAVILNGVFHLCVLSSVIARYLGPNRTARKSVCADASPVSHVHPGSPPFFIGHGTADRVVPYSAAEAFIANLREAHVVVTPFVAQDGPHMYWQKKDFYQQNLEALETFLASELQPAVAAP